MLSQKSLNSERTNPSAKKIIYEQNQPTSKEIPTLEEAKIYIESLDFAMIIDKMTQHQGWSKADALKLSKMYRNYLYLQKKYGDQHALPPSEEIDEFWHNHILDTKKYQEDCQRVFGDYLHHYPYFGIDGSSNSNVVNDAFLTMQKLYYEEFGEMLLEVRTLFSKILFWFNKTLFTSKPARVFFNKNHMTT